MAEETKRCIICGEEKPLSEFYFRKDNNKYRNDCKSCNNKQGHQYRLAHLDQEREHNRKYREAHKEELAEYSKNYQKAHLDKFREYNKKARENWTPEQRERANERSRRSHEKRKENPEYLERRRQWSRESAKRRRKTITAYEEARKKRDPIFKLKKQIRNEIRDAFNRRGFKKSESTEDIVGCNIEYLQRHLLMTYLIRYGEEWDGVTPVHIDHIVPLSTAYTEEEVYRLNRYTNLQLLRAEDNLAKGDSEEPDSYEDYIQLAS